MNMKRIAIIGLLLPLFCALPALAGTTGVLRGQVLDRITHRPIGGATVAAVSAQTVAKTTTDANGNYVFIDLCPGVYTVSVQALGFQPVSIANVTVQADQAQTLAISPYPRLMLIVDFVYYRRTSLVRPGTMSDVYTIYTPSMRDSSLPVRTPAEELRFVPGVQAGPGLSVPHG